MSEETFIRDVIAQHRTLGCNGTQRALARTIIALERRLGDRSPADPSATAPVERESVQLLMFTPRPNDD